MAGIFERYLRPETENDQEALGTGPGAQPPFPVHQLEISAYGGGGAVYFAAPVPLGTPRKGCCPLYGNGRSWSWRSRR